ncbi:ArsR/SmtB family transcription factor [Amycolatopsis sp. NBC_01286]|uniref:ArsR/SmtB family transcription factor n=1 Tax=Amycolatopsis sp. NBC_01286 TaxID=2903560 RepID=UPI003FA3C07B
MPGEPDITSVAQAIGEPARAAMLLQLMDGAAHSARALATVAGIAPSTASSHLRRLRDAGLVRPTRGANACTGWPARRSRSSSKRWPPSPRPGCPSGSNPTHRRDRCCGPGPATATWADSSASTSRHCCARTA